MAAPRLMIVVTDLELGGAPLHLLRVVPGLCAAGYAVTVVSLADPGPIGPELVAAGVAVASCRARGVGDVRALWRLGRLIRRCRPHILHGVLFHANLAVRLVGPVAGVPSRRILCEIHTVEVERRWHLWLDNLTCRLCALELGISTSVVRHLRRVGHLPAARLHVLEGGIDVERFAGASPRSRRALGVREHVPLLLWVGRFDPVKGFETLIAAFARLRRERDVQLLLVGDGPYRPVVERLVADFNVRDDVILAGPRRDIPEVMAAADVFVFPSRTEGLPTALLEAMASGRAVVTTDVPGCRDVVRCGRDGLLVPPGAPDKLAEAVRRLLSDEALRMRLAACGQQHVRERFGSAAVAERYRGVYRRMIQRHRWFPVGPFFAGPSS